MKKIFSLSLLLLAFMSFESCISIKLTSKKKSAAAALAAQKPDPKPKKGDLKPYDEIITEDAVSDSGLFTVHKIDADFFSGYLPFSFPNYVVSHLCLIQQ